ncbi:hypothetical protein GWI33_018844 [Rhynchophorus ferrugineus]|uniref:Peptidase S1 domain-containing protein n=1 Tax=Rhynchophorus ferrugineus TaxID=354439 RepID=A0A834HV08_RHYFE|nr:hypothetical protein GWI33_018844 [Rhynchophorus ferrugineus]
MDKTIVRGILIGVLVSSSFSEESKEVTPDHFPFQAFVMAYYSTAGALITIEHVITIAEPINGSELATVYLGFQGDPYYEINTRERQGQIIRSKDIIIHSHFKNISGKYINNVAIVVLGHPVELSSSVQPIDLSTVLPSPGSFANISGWRPKEEVKLQYLSVRLHDVDTCLYLYGTALLQTQELCYEEYPSSGLNLVGNPLTINKKLIGLLTFNAMCVNTSFYCNNFHISINLFPFITWINTQIGVGANLRKLEALTEENKQLTELIHIKELQNTTLEAINKLNQKTNDIERVVEQMLLVQINDRKENKDIIASVKRTNETVHNLLQRLTSILLVPEET